MKKFHRRRAHGRRILLCLLALALLFVVLALRQNILLDTASRHALLMDAQTGQVLAQKRANEKVVPASLTKMMTVLLAIEAQPDLDQPVTLPEDVFPELTAENASMAGFAPSETVTVRDVLYGAMLPSGAECCEALARLVSDNRRNGRRAHCGHHHGSRRDCRPDGGHWDGRHGRGARRKYSRSVRRERWSR